MKTHVPWTTAEEKIVRDHYETSATRDQICAMVPRHTWYAIRSHAARELGLVRPTGCDPRPAPAWDRIATLLKNEELTISQIADRLKMKQSRAHYLLTQHQREVHIAGWEPPESKGRWERRWAYGDEPDAAAPFVRHTAAAKTARANNPFMAAAGMVPVPVGQPGRVFKQDMSIRDDEMEEQAA